jgi:hypothetical protein
VWLVALARVIIFALTTCRHSNNFSVWSRQGDVDDDEMYCRRRLFFRPFRSDRWWLADSCVIVDWVGVYVSGGIDGGWLVGCLDSSLRVPCYALLRMRPLSISCAEGFVVISCGKVDYDKSGWWDDWLQMCRLCIHIYIYAYICMIDSRIQRREIRSWWNAWWQKTDWFWVILDRVILYLIWWLIA